MSSIDPTSVPLGHAIVSDDNPQKSEHQHPATSNETTALLDEPDVSPEPSARRNSLSGEICRKILHMTPGLLPFLLYFLPHPDPLETESLIFVTVLCVLITLAYLTLHRIVRRPDEGNFLTTTLSYPLIVWATLVLFPAHAEFAMVVVIILALGDGSAYIAGRTFGTIKLPWNRDKSWAGLIGFIAVSAPLATWAYFLEANNPRVPLAMAALCAGAASVMAAVAESWPTEISDNLRVGLAAAGTVIITHYLSVPFFIG